MEFLRSNEIPGKTVEFNKHTSLHTYTQTPSRPDKTLRSRGGVSKNNNAYQHGVTPVHNKQPHKHSHNQAYGRTLQ